MTATELHDKRLTESGEARLYAHVHHRHATGTLALEVELLLHAGITILFGPSGAGKTTLLDILAGLITPQAGRVVLGEEVLFDSDKRVCVSTQQRRVGYLFQSPALFPHLTARQNLEYGLQQLSAEVRAGRSASLLEAFKVAHLAGRKPSEISGGEAQRVALARALAPEPRYLLLDEPLGGLDAPTKSRIVADLRNWNRTHKIPILFVTHDQAEVYALGDRVLVLENGSLVADGAPHEILEVPRLESVAQLAGFENVFDAEVVGIHPEQGTMTCKLLPRVADPATSLQAVFSGTSADVPVETPLGNVSAGGRVRIALRAGDILVGTESPRGLSARNLLPARITSLERRRGLVTMTAECEGLRSASGRTGVCFEVHVTPGAAQSLELAEGKSVWLVIKTHAWRILG